MAGELRGAMVAATVSVLVGTLLVTGDRLRAGWRTAARAGTAATAGTSATGPASSGESTPAATPSATAAAGPATVSSTVHGVRCTGPDTAAGRATAARLQQRIAAAAGRSTRLSAAVHDWTTGVSCSYRGAAHYDSASIIKATTLATLLWQAQRAGRSLTGTERGWARLAITQSDNDAESDLWSDAGGACGVQQFLRTAGMTSTTAATGGLWGLTQVTAGDQLTLLEALAHGGLLNAAGRRYELGLMRSVISSQRWGVPVGAPIGTTVAVKNGWLPEAAGWDINTIGYLTGAGHEYAMAVLSKGNASMDSGVAAVQAVTRAVHTALAAQ